MESLTKTQVDAIKKLNTARLITKLAQVGYSEEELDTMDREALMGAWATCVADGKDKPAAPSNPSTGYDVELERQKLEFEMRKFEAEQKMKKAELQMLQQKYAAECEEKDSVVMRAKRYGDAIKASVTVMGSEPLDVVLFFTHIEAVFDCYKVPIDLQAALLQPYLNAKARSVVARMDPSLYHDYEAVRNVILKEHELSPRSYLDFFNTLSRSSGETCVMYCAKLKSLLTMYVESRKVKDFDALLSLIVCDRVKSVLNEGCLRHVLSVEAAAADGWLRADKLAEIVDTYMANHFSNDRPRASAIGTAQQVGVDVESTAGKPPPRPPPPTFPQPSLQSQSQRRDTGQYRPPAGSIFRPPNALNTNITTLATNAKGLDIPVSFVLHLVRILTIKVREMSVALMLVLSRSLDQN